MLTAHSDRCITAVLHHTFITNKRNAMVLLFRLRSSKIAGPGPSRAAVTHLFFFGCPVAVKHATRPVPVICVQVSAQTTSVTVAALEYPAQETNPSKIWSALAYLWLTVGAVGWQPHGSSGYLQ